jgi:hypothetical protein
MSLELSVVDAQSHKLIGMIEKSLISTSSHNSSGKDQSSGVCVGFSVDLLWETKCLMIANMVVIILHFLTKR